MAQLADKWQKTVKSIYHFNKVVMFYMRHIELVTQLRTQIQDG